MRPFYSSALANMFLTLLPNTKFFPFKRLVMRMLGFDVGCNVKFNGGVKFFGRGDVLFGDNSWIGMGCIFINANAVIKIGKNCDLAPFIKINTGSHDVGPRARRAGRGYCKDILIGNGVWVGMDSIFIAGSEVKSGSVVGAGSVVTKKFGDNILIAGCPAKVIKELE